jgi:hypothetical protein
MSTDNIVNRDMSMSLVFLGIIVEVNPVIESVLLVNHETISDLNDSAQENRRKYIEFQ